MPRTSTKLYVHEFCFWSGSGHGKFSIKFPDPQPWLSVSNIWRISLFLLVKKLDLYRTPEQNGSGFVATTSFPTCRTFEGHTGGISCLQFDSNRIVSGSHDKTIKVKDAEHCDVLRFWRPSLHDPACDTKFAVSYAFINWFILSLSFRYVSRPVTSC